MKQTVVQIYNEKEFDKLMKLYEKKLRTTGTWCEAKDLKYCISDVWYVLLEDCFWISESLQRVEEQWFEIITVEEAEKRLFPGEAPISINEMNEKLFGWLLETKEVPENPLGVSLEEEILEEQKREPVRGDIVEVSNSGFRHGGVKRIYITTIEQAQNPIVCVAQGSEAEFKEGWRLFYIEVWAYMRKTDSIKKLTKAEIEKELWYDIEIVE